MEVLFIISSILFVALEIFLIVFLIFKIKRYRRLTLKDTIVYPIVVLLTIVTLIVTKLFYLQEKGFQVVSSSLNDSVSIVALSLNMDVFNGLLEYNSVASKFVLATYIGEYLVSALALLSISFLLVHIAFVNTCRKIKNFLSLKNQEVDYVIGFNEDVQEYVKAYCEKYVMDSNNKGRNHRMIVVLNSAVLNSYESEKFYLHKYKTSFITKPYTTVKDIKKTIKQLSFGKRSKRIISFLDDDRQNFLFVNEALQYVVENDKDVKFIVVANNSQEAFLKNIIYEKDVNNSTKDKSNGRINIYNKYNLISLEFIKNHNFAKYFPKKFVNDDLTISDDCDINLYFFGFGNVNQALLRDILITNQFVRKAKDGDKTILLPKRLNVEVFESKLKIESMDLFNGILKYKKEKYQNPERFLELPEDYVSTVHLNSNVSIYEEKFINDLFNTIKKKANDGKYQINYFIVSIDSDFVNCNIAKRLKNNFDHIEGAHNTYFIRLKEDLFDIEDNMISFGRCKDVLSYDNVVGNHIYDTANLFHYYYEEKKEYAKTSTPLEFKSNLYNVSSLYFKLSLLYLKKKEDKEYNITTLASLMEEYIMPDPFTQYDLANSSNDEFYNNLCDGIAEENFNIRDVFAFIEHERWNAYELSQGSLPMSKEYCEKQLDYICKKIVSNEQGELSELFCKFDEENNRYKIKFNKTLDELYHLCLTTNKGLKEYYYYLSKIFKEYCDKYNLKNLVTSADVVFYDYKYMDVVKKDISSDKEMEYLYNDLNNFLRNGN